MFLAEHLSSNFFKKKESRSIWFWTRTSDRNRQHFSCGVHDDTWAVGNSWRPGRPDVVQKSRQVELKAQWRMYFGCLYVYAQCRVGKGPSSSWPLYTWRKEHALKKNCNRIATERSVWNELSMHYWCKCARASRWSRPISLTDLECVGWGRGNSRSILSVCVWTSEQKLGRNAMRKKNPIKTKRCDSVGSRSGDLITKDIAKSIELTNTLLISFNLIIAKSFWTIDWSRFNWIGSNKDFCSQWTVCTSSSQDLLGTLAGSIHAGMGLPPWRIFWNFYEKKRPTCLFVVRCWDNLWSFISIAQWHRMYIRCGKTGDSCIAFSLLSVAARTHVLISLGKTETDTEGTRAHIENKQIYRCTATEFRKPIHSFASTKMRQKIIWLSSLRILYLWRGLFSQDCLWRSRPSSHNKALQSLNSRNNSLLQPRIHIELCRKR